MATLQRFLSIDLLILLQTMDRYLPLSDLLVAILTQIDMALHLPVALL